MPGLYLPQKSTSGRTLLLWLLASAMLVIGGLTAWWTIQYYNTGAQPPLPIPVAMAFENEKIDETPVSDAQRNSHTVAADEPRYISIPSLKIEKVRVFGVGVTADGTLDAPKNIHDAAWFNKSARPGDGSGVVLIDAHNGGVSRDGVFAALDGVGSGDKVTIERGDGERFTYTIVENRTVSLDEANKTGMKRVSEPYDPNKEGLGLITCAGVYVPKIGAYNKRVFIRAVADNQ